MLFLFYYIFRFNNFKYSDVIVMIFSNKDTSLKANLKKKTTIKDELNFSGYDIQACMVMLVVITVLLYLLFLLQLKILISYIKIEHS